LQKKFFLQIILRARGGTREETVWQLFRIHLAWRLV